MDEEVCIEFPDCAWFRSSSLMLLLKALARGSVARHGSQVQTRVLEARGYLMQHGPTVCPAPSPVGRSHLIAHRAT